MILPKGKIKSGLYFHFQVLKELSVVVQITFGAEHIRICFDCGTDLELAKQAALTSAKHTRLEIHQRKT